MLTQKHNLLCPGWLKRRVHSVTNLLHFTVENSPNLDNLLCDVRIRLQAGGILAWKEVRAMSEELREKETRLFQSLKEALEKSKSLGKSCLA
jgi:hypothetical protein